MRKINSMKNFFTTFMPYIIIALLGFVKTKIFVANLGDDIYALDQLFFQILAYISLAEGGVGLFIVQKYYKCFVDNDKEKINEIYSSSRKILKYIGIFMVFSGIITSFFISHLTNNSLSFSYMQIVFILFLFKNLIDYFMFAPRFVLQGDQKLYKVNLLVNFIRILDLIIFIVLIKLGVDYLVILIPGIFIKIIFNLIINRLIYKEYPWLKLDKNANIKMFNGIRHIFAQKISGVLYYNTDIILISAFIKPIEVVIYASYNYLSKTLVDVIDMFCNALSPSFGNVLFKENKEVQYETFNELNTLFYFISGFASIMFLLFSKPFVDLWIGQKYSIDSYSLIFMGLILYITISRRMIMITKDNLGLFKETKYFILLEAILNLGISLLLVHKFEIAGVLFATMISTLMTTFWYIPYYIFKKYFNKSFFLYIRSYLITISIFSLIYYVFKKYFIVSIETFPQWFIYAIIYGIILFIILFAIFYVAYKPFRTLIKKWYHFLIVKRRGQQ